MLKRAARLAEMDFMQIMQDLSPDAISQIRIISGEKEGRRMIADECMARQCN